MSGLNTAFVYKANCWWNQKPHISVSASSSGAKPLSPWRQIKNLSERCLQLRPKGQEQRISRNVKTSLKCNNWHWVDLESDKLRVWTCQHPAARYSSHLTSHISHLCWLEVASLGLFLQHSPKKHPSHKVIKSHVHPYEDKQVLSPVLLKGLIL